MLPRSNRGTHATLMPEAEYQRRYVIGKYTPAMPPHIGLQRLRARAIKRGKCIECRCRPKDGDYSHCRVCLDKRSEKSRGR